MKIKRVEITGFKSFVDRTVVSFDHDIVCVVGPNGCGKSNIVDSIRWAMGEQSAKHLRGKSMEDVIFGGCEARGPHSFAEVTLTFDNADGQAPPEYRDYAEIAVTRRLDRAGHSEYLINGVAVRLMDVTNLFLGTGVGTKAYSIVEQGRIGFIVSSRPEERRYLIEEAAGVTKFKTRKRAAERKLEYTRQNLLRVNDIVTELEKSLASLKRQADKAERYRRYRSELEGIELRGATHRWFELFSRRRSLEVRLSDAEQAVEAIRQSLSARDAGLEAQRIELRQQESDVERLQTAAFETSNRVQLLEAQIRHGDERAGAVAAQRDGAENELQASLAQISALSDEADVLREGLDATRANEQSATSIVQERQLEIERFQQQVHETERQLAEARDRQARLRTELARLEVALQAAEARRSDDATQQQRLEEQQATQQSGLDTFATRIVELDARVAALQASLTEREARREQLQADLASTREQRANKDAELAAERDGLLEARSRLDSLNSLRAKYVGANTGVQALLGDFATNEGGAGIVQGLLADHVQCDPEWLPALTAAFGERLQYVLAANADVGINALEFLGREQRGRASVLVEELALPGPEGYAGADFRSEAGVLGPLSAFARALGAQQNLVQCMMSGVWVVEDLAVAMRLQRALRERGPSQARPTWVTRGGEVLHADGAITGGVRDEVGAHLVDVKREIALLESAVAERDAVVERLTSEAQNLATSLAAFELELEAARESVHATQMELLGAQRDAQAATDERRKLHTLLEQLRTEQARLAARVSNTDEELSGWSERRGELTDELERVTREFAEFDGRLQDQRARLAATSLEFTELRVRAAEVRQRRESDEAALMRVERALAELDERKRRLESVIASSASEIERLRDSRAELVQALDEAVSNAQVVQSELDEARAAFDAKRSAVDELELSLRGERSEFQDRNDALGALRMQLQEAVLGVEHLVEHVRERHRVNLLHVLVDYHALPETTEDDLRRAEELTGLLDRMGPVNLLAIDEYNEQQQRYTFLVGQRQDLETAVQQLETAIGKMNRESKRLFREAFEAINENFKHMFVRLFGGGKGELRLTESEDLLDAGVEIIAMPPGKRLGSIELMSGGEKALTAVSLILAMFQYRPSPFCLLDEVDAPLDEANVGRYVDAVRSLTDRSQFILITHSKRTMESADVLYGVTMETPGISTLVRVTIKQALDSVRPPQRARASDASAAMLS